MEVGEREIIYLSLHCHHRNDSCIKMGSEETVNYWPLVGLCQSLAISRPSVSRWPLVGLPSIIDHQLAFRQSLAISRPSANHWPLVGLPSIIGRQSAFRQSDEHWNCLRKLLRYGRGGAHMGFSERTDTPYFRLCLSARRKYNEKCNLRADTTCLRVRTPQQCCESRGGCPVSQ